jgi:hypothetical protein
MRVHVPALDLQSRSEVRAAQYDFPSGYRMYGHTHRLRPQARQQGRRGAQPASRFRKVNAACLGGEKSGYRCHYASLASLGSKAGSAIFSPPRHAALTFLTQARARASSPASERSRPFRSDCGLRPAGSRRAGYIGGRVAARRRQRNDPITGHFPPFLPGLKSGVSRKTSSPASERSRPFRSDCGLRPAGSRRAGYIELGATAWLEERRVPKDRHECRI